jgi:hypothetical protein
VFTTSAIITYVKITPYIEGVLSPSEAKICTFIVPAAPTNVAMDISTNNISFTWDAVANAVNYTIRAFCNGIRVFAKVVTTNSAVVLRNSIANSIYTIPYVNIEFRISANVNMILGIESSTIWAPDPDNLIFCRTYNDAVVSGIAKIIRLQDALGNYYYTKVYPTISANVGGSIDNIGYDLYGLSDAILSSIANVVGIKSDEVFYFFKVFSTISVETGIITGTNITLDFLSDVIISGTPRVAEIQLNGVNYYLKVYPTRS